MRFLHFLFCFLFFNSFVQAASLSEASRIFLPSQAQDPVDNSAGAEGKDKIASQSSSNKNIAEQDKKEALTESKKGSSLSSPDSLKSDVHVQSSVKDQSVQTLSDRSNAIIDGSSTTDQSSSASSVHHQEGESSEVKTSVVDQSNSEVSVNRDVSHEEPTSVREEVQHARSSIVNKTPFDFYRQNMDAYYHYAVEKIESGQDLLSGYLLLSSFYKVYPHVVPEAEVPYYMGLALYKTGEYAASMNYFREVYYNFPRNPKVPQALWMLFLANAQNGQNEEACKNLMILKESFPDISGQIIDVNQTDKVVCRPH